MTARHIIGEALFDIRFGAHAPFGEHELATFVQERLLPVMEEVFEQLSADGTRCRIDQLVVDLGDIPAAIFLEELPNRFKEELLRRLLEKVTTIRSRPAQGEFVMTRSELRRLRLEQFLETGRMSHERSDNGPADMDHLLLATLRADHTAFAAYVRRSPRREVIIGRLARQFSTGTLASLLRLLNRENGTEWLSDNTEDSLEEMERRLRTLFGEEPDISGASSTAARTASTTNGMVSTADGTTSTADITISAADGMVSIADGMVSIADEIVSIADGMVSTVDGMVSTVDGMVSTADGIVSTADGIVSTADGIVSTADGIASTADGIVSTADGIVPNGDGTVPNADGTAPNPDGAVFTGGGTLPPGGMTPTSSEPQRAGEGGPAPTAIAEEREGYAVSQLRGRIDHALVFGDPRAIYHSWAWICAAHPALVRAIFMRRMGAAASRRRLAEGFPQSMLLDISALLAPGHDRLLAALLEQPEMRDSGEEECPADIRNAFWFYTVTYLHNAGPDRFRPEEYLRGLIPHLQQSGLERARVRALVQRVIPAVPRFHEVKPASTTPPDAVYCRLLRRLGGDRSEPPMAKEIAWLARARPELLRQLYQQLQAGDVALDTEPLDGAEAEALVHFFVNPGHPRAASGFLGEIEKHAEQARDRRRYYLHVLEAIAHNRIVDLEQAMAQPAAPGEGAHGSTDFQTHFEFLLAHAAPDPLEAVLDHLEPGQDELVRTAFLRAAAATAVRRRMALAMPEPLLLRLLTLMVPQAERLFRVLTALPEMENNELRIHVWEEALAEVQAAEARRFDHGDFARRLHDAAASHGLRPLADVASRILTEGAGEAGETRIEYLYRRVSERLVGRHACDRTNEMTELATDYPAVFRHLLSRFHAGEFASDTPSLTPDELGRLSALASTHSSGRRPWPSAAVSDASMHPFGATQEASHEKRRQPPLQELRARFSEAMVLGLAAPIGDCWSECLSHPSMVRSAFMRQMGTDDSRSRLADGFSTAMLLELAAVLAPNHHRFIETLLEHSGLSSERHGEASTRTLRNAFWSYTLAFLHDTGPGEFLPDVYLRGLAPRLAHNGLEPVRIHALLRHVTPDAAPTPCFPPPNSDALYHRLNNRLNGAAGEPVMGDEIRWLARHRPELLQQIIWQWQSAIAPPVLNHMDGEEAEALVTSFVAQDGKAAAGFLTEIEKHAAHARDRRSYFLHLLQCLIRRTTVDLEFAMGLPPKEIRVAAEPGKQDGAIAPEPEPPSLIAGAHLIAAVEHRLQNPHISTPVAPLLKELAQREPALFADLYRRWRSGEFAEALPALALEEIRLLVLGFAELTAGGAMPGIRRQIEAHAGIATDKDAYYRFLLVGLIRGEAIDLERGTSQERDRDVNQPVSSRDKTMAVDQSHLPGEEWREETVIANAGLVITAPFLPRLFSLLELTTERGFRNEATAAKAAHLLQHTVNGSSDSPEFLLPLNKILCGVAPSHPIIRAIEVTNQEDEAITHMLQALIAHWKIIGNTSVQGLRESFLQREGRLRFGGDRWLLEVEKRGIDVLLEQIPWSISMIKYSWMPWPLHVEWH